MTLQIDNPSIFEHPKSVFETTLSAMKEAESVEDAGIVNIDSVASFIQEKDVSLQPWNISLPFSSVWRLAV